jgi:lysylphosphatidylglycerol synthetase-like protein (DUF2156 family)
MRHLFTDELLPAIDRAYPSSAEAKSKKRDSPAQETDRNRANKRTDEPVRNCLAYSSCSGDLHSFECPGLGTVLFITTRAGITYALGDPLTDEANVTKLLARFLEEFPKACFVQVSALTAEYLCSRGYYANHLGVETELFLPVWRCTGPKSHMLRKQRKKSERAGVTIREITADEEQLRAAKAVSEVWLLEEKSTDIELRIMTRPPCFSYEKHTRKFAAYLNGRITAIAFFDPLSLSEPDAGYVYQIARSRPGSPSGIRTHLLLHAIDVFRKEKTRYCSLGLSPLPIFETEKYPHSPLARALSRTIRFVSQIVFNYEGMAFYKSRFGGKQRTVYYCSRSYFPIRSAFVLLNETGFIRASLHRLFFGLRNLVCLRTTKHANKLQSDDC